jgi:hypothetical protein
MQSVHVSLKAACVRTGNTDGSREIGTPSQPDVGGRTALPQNVPQIVCWSDKHSAGRLTLFRVRERSFQTFDFRLERQFAVSIHLGGRVEAELLVLGVEGFRIILKLSMVWGRLSTNNCSPPAAMPALYW